MKKKVMSWDDVPPGFTVPKSLGSFDLREHQVEAVSRASFELSSNGRCQVVMACGSGKTLVGAAVGVSLSARRTLVLMPSLALVKQTISAYRSFGMDAGRRFVAVCSDESVADDDDDVVVMPSEIEAELANDENLRTGDLVCFCTYKSVETLGGLHFDFIVFDEAHRTSGSVEKVFGFALHDANVSAEKRLFLTATPRYEEELDDDGRCLVHSMDDVVVYGRKVYDLSFQEAVRRGCCVDYEILVVCAKNRVDVNAPNSLMVAADKVVTDFGATKIFSFHTSVKDAMVFAGVRIKGSPLRSFHVNGKMSSRERRIILDDFSSRKAAIVSNVRCLAEGVNVPDADAVFFVVAKKGTVDIAQACGRIMRPFPGKKRCFVVLPLLFDEGEDLEDVALLSVGSRFEKLVRVLRALKAHDASLADALPRFGNARGALEIPKTTIVGVELSGRVLERLREAIILKLVGSFNRDPDWRKNKLLRLAADGGSKPSIKNFGSAEEKMLAHAFYHYTNPNVYMYDEGFANEMRRLVPRWFVKDRFAERMDVLLAMAIRGDKRPNPHSDDKEERVLGNFFADAFRRRNKRDSDFVDEVLRVNPAWSLRGRMDGLWDSIFEWARSGKGRPSQTAIDATEKKLAVFLSGLSPRKKRRGLPPEDDKKFDEIRKLVPLWFDDGVKEHRQSLLREMAISGGPPPNIGDELYATFRNSQKTDFEFFSWLKKRRPDWFPGTGNYDRSKARPRR